VGTPVIDADAHLSEPRDLWSKRMSSDAWGDHIPAVRVDPVTGYEAWFIADQKIGPFGGSVMVRTEGDGYPTKWREDLPAMPPSDEIHDSAWDSAARLEIMDRHGIAVSALFGNLGVSRNYFRAIDDDSFKRELVQVYNDFLAEWIRESSEPERFIGLANLPFWDVAAAATEVGRAAGLGHRGVVITGIPDRHGLPPFADRSWDVLWEACTEHQMPIHFHAGGGDISGSFNERRQAAMGGGALQAAGTTNIILETAQSLSDLLTSGVLPRFPETRWIVVESAVGYLPFVLESTDYHFRTYMEDRPEYSVFEELPSAYFDRQVYGTYWFERLDQHFVDRVGAGRLLFETDYPHPTCLLEDDIREATNVALSGIAREDRERILWRNAADLYGITNVPEVASLAD
jgi:predicted TIM-barrel fold metal-dependent hydrolase